MSSEDSGRSSYLDLLIATLMKHEKNLDALVEKLENICENFQTFFEESTSKTEKASLLTRNTKTAKSDSDSLIYMKIKIGRELNDIIRIIESLKE